MRTTLADIRAAAERKYGSYEIELDKGRVLTLRHALRLPDKERDELFALIQTVRSEGGSEEQNFGVLVGAIRQMVRLIGDNTERADELIESIGDDLTVMMEIFEGYTEVAMPGEASPSPDSSPPTEPPSTMTSPSSESTSPTS